MYMAKIIIFLKHVHENPIVESTLDSSIASSTLGIDVPTKISSHTDTNLKFVK